MSPDIILVLGCLGLGLLIAYIMWSSVRPTLLQLDLQQIVFELDAAAKAGRVPDDTNYRAARELIILLSRLAPYISLPALVVFRPRPVPLTQEQSSATTAVLTSWGKTLSPELQQAWLLVLVRIIIHFATSPLDVMIMLVLYASGRSEQLTSWLTTPWQDLNRLGQYLRPRTDIPAKAV